MRIGIIGCGIVGAYLAWRLAKQGHDVLVFEEKRKIGGKACSGLISGRLWKFIPKNKKLIKHTIRCCNIKFPRKTSKLYFSPRMMVIDRSGLDRYVAGLAKKAGAKIYTGHRAKKIFLRRKSKLQASFETGKISKVLEFDRIIGADGALSVVRKELVARDPKFRLGIYSYKRQKNRKGSVDTFPLSNGFSWKIPAKRKIEVGTIHDKKNAKKEFKKIKRKFKVAKKSRKYSALVPTGIITTNTRKVALCGDAAGLTKPWSGGGVIWGLTAADILVKNFPRMRKYNRKLRRKFGAQMMLGNIMNTGVMFAGNYLPWLLPNEVIFDPDFM